MSGMQLVYLLLAGLAAAGGQFSITAAYFHAAGEGDFRLRLFADPLFGGDGIYRLWTDSGCFELDWVCADLCDGSGNVFLQ